MPRKELKFSENERKGQFNEVLCATCGGPKRHEVIASYDEAGNEDYGRFNVSWNTSYQIIKCHGCQTVSYRTLTSSSEDTPDLVGNEYVWSEAETLYPHRTDSDMPIRAFSEVPYEIVCVYEEAINCINRGSPILAAGGLRAVIDGICADHDVKDGLVTNKETGAQVRSRTLDGKISGLHEKGFLTKQLADALHENRLLGNSALHELVQHRKADLVTAAQIIEHVLITIYEVKKKTEKLKAAREKRERRKDR